VKVPRRCIHIGGWLVIAPLLAVTAARLVAWDSRSVLVGLNAATPLVFLPAWPVAVVAGALRLWALVGVACVVVVAHASFVLPEVLAASPLPAAAKSAPGLRLFDANVFEGNGDAGGYAEEIRRSRPDLVILQEPSPAFVAAIEASEVLRDLPYRVSVSRSDPFAVLVASRWPITGDEVVSDRGRPILVRASVTVGGEAIRLFAFHAVAPVGGTREEWEAELAALGKAVSAERRPVLVVGDFNATWGNRAFRHLLNLGLVDAAAARGDPFQMTWPRNRRFVPPFLRIDHVLTTEPLVVTRIGAGTGHGSDHRPIVADVVRTP